MPSLGQREIVSPVEFDNNNIEMDTTPETSTNPDNFLTRKEESEL